MLSLKIKTTSRSGLLLYSGRYGGGADYITVYLASGRVGLIDFESSLIFLAGACRIKKQPLFNNGPWLADNQTRDLNNEL